MKLLLALYMAGRLVGVDVAPDLRADCDRVAARETAGFADRGDAAFTVRCIADTDPALVMARKLHPELRGK